MAVEFGDTETRMSGSSGSSARRRLRALRLEQISKLLALNATDDRARARNLAKERIAALDAKIAQLKEARDTRSRLAEKMWRWIVRTMPDHPGFCTTIRY